MSLRMTVCSLCSLVFSMTLKIPVEVIIAVKIHLGQKLYLTVLDVSLTFNPAAV